MFLILLVFMSLACETIMGKPSQATTQPPAGQAPVQPPVIQLPNLTGVQLGDELRDEECGYSFRKIPGYQYDQSMPGFDSSTAPGADKDTGPYIIISCGTPNTSNLDEWIKGATTNTSGTPEAYPLTYSNRKNVTIGGVNGESLDMEGSGQSGIVIKGREVFAMVTPHRVFFMIGAARSDKWEETRPYFEAVMNSITFFEPPTTPTANP